MIKKFFLITILVASTGFVYSQLSTPSQNLERHVYTLASDSLLGRGFGTEQGTKAATYIARQFKEAGIEPLNGTYFHPFNHRKGILNIPGVNVAGVITGSNPDLKEEYIVLGAHYDHLGWKISNGDTVVYNGADDNASGTASIIEIGRNLASQKESLGRSVIIVAFDGEESGLIGSNHFLKDSIVQPEQIKLMFSLDMVGMYEARGGLDMVGVKLLNDSEEVTGTLASKYNITILKANATIGQRTDTAPFGEIGIPAIHTYTGSESPYHKPEDVAEALDYEGMAMVANYISATTHYLSSVENLSDMKGPQDGQADLSGKKVFRPGVRLNMGTSHHKYREEFYEGKSMFSAKAGVFTTIRISSFLAIQPEVLYETKGSQHIDGKFRTHSITAPLNLRISSPENEMVQTYMLVGGYYSYHFGGKIDDTNIDFQDVYQNQEFGLSYGFGLQVMNVQVGMTIWKGVSSILQDPASGSVTYDGISLSLGYVF
ncbi:MAG: M28 family peptidase [Bacteroidota bacterium]